MEEKDATAGVENDAQKRPPRARRRKARRGISRTVLGAVLLATVAAVGWWLSPQFGGAPSAPAAVRTSDPIGIIDAEAVLKAHHAYPQLASLREARDAIKAESEALQRLLLRRTAPKAAQAPFGAAAHERQFQESVKAHSELRARLLAAEKTERERMRPALEATRDEINAEYFNEIFNIQLKLDNRQSMRLPDETVAQLTERLHALQRERGARQYRLWREHEDVLRERLEAIAAAEGVKLEDVLVMQTEGQRARALREQAQAQTRNLEMMRQNLLEVAKIRERLEKVQRTLLSKEQEVRAMEDAMRQEIASKATKLAMMHHLSVVLASPAKNINALPRGLMLHIGAWPREDAPVIGAGAMDLTKELAKELQ